MGFERGRNSGITGVVDIAGFSALTTGRIYGMEQAIETKEKRRMGRGSGRWEELRPFMPGGTILFSGDVQASTPPLASQFENQVGTVNLQYDVGSVETLYVRCQKATIHFDEKSQDKWKVGLVFRILRQPTFAGFDNQQPRSAADPILSTQEQWDGTSKTVDPDGLQTAAERIYDVWGVVDDTDAAELSLVASCVLLAAPTGLHKPRLASVTRTDLLGLVITVKYALTTTGEDEINSHAKTTIDPQGITSEATTASWTGTSPTPTTGGNWVLVDTTTVNYNQSKTLTITKWALRNSKQTIEMDGTSTTADTTGVVVRRVITQVNASSTPPTTPTANADDTLYSTTSEQINPGTWKHRFEFRPGSPVEEIDWEGTEPQDDPQDLTDSERITVSTTTTTAPVTPPTTTIVGLKNIRIIGPKQKGRARYFWTYVFGWRDSKDDIEMGESSTTSDQTGIVVRRIITQVTTSVTPPTPPVANLDDILYNTTTTQLTGGKWKHRFEYHPASPTEELSWAGTDPEFDPQTLTDTEQITVTSTTTAVPSTPASSIGLKLIKRHGPLQKGRFRYVWTFHFGWADTKDQIEKPGTWNESDPNSIRTAEQITAVNTSSTPPSLSPLLGTSKLRRVRHTLRSDGHWVHTAEYGDQNTLDELQQNNTRYKIDTVAISDRDLVAVRNTSSTAPATPSARSGLKVVGYESRQINDGNWLHVFEYARASQIDQIVAQGTNTTTDPKILDSKGEITTVETTSTPAPATAPSGLQYRDTSVKPIAGTGYYVQSHRYGLATTQQDHEIRGTHDAYQNYSQSISRVAEVVPISTTLDSDLSTYYQANKVISNFFGVEGIAITPGKMLRTTIWGQERHTLKAKFWYEQGYFPCVLDNSAKQRGYWPVFFKSPDTGIAMVRLVAKWQPLGSSVWWAQLHPVWANQTVGMIEITTIRTHVTEYMYQTYLNLIGTVNPTQFLGFPKGTCRYIGSVPEANLRISLPRKDQITYQFRYQELGHWDSRDVITGYIPTTTDLTDARIGLNPASLFGWDAGPADLGTSNFSVFLP